MKPRLRVLIWNVGESKTPIATLTELLKQHRPDVVIVSEAYRLRAWLQDMPGYRLRQPRTGEGTDLAVLVRKDTAKIRHHRFVQMREAWIGPERLIPRDPRTFQRLIVVVDGQEWDVLGAHFPPGGPTGGYTMKGRNKAAWMESIRRVGRIVAKATARAQKREVSLAPQVVGGDLNATAEQLAEFAEAMGLTVRAGGKVDHLLTSGCTLVRKGRVLDVIPHPPLLFVLEAN